MTELRLINYYSFTLPPHHIHIQLDFLRSPIQTYKIINMTTTRQNAECIVSIIIVSILFIIYASCCHSKGQAKKKE